MDEMCYECMKSDSDYVVMKTCLTCHHSVCSYCQRKHEELSAGHLFHFTAHICHPESFCKEHKGQVVGYLCRSCDSMICRSCSRHKHRDHFIQSISDIGREIRDEIKRMNIKIDNELIAVEKDWVSCSAELTHISKQLSIAKREAENFLDKVVSLMMADIKHIGLYYGLHDDIDHFLKEMHTLVARRRINSVIKSCVLSIARSSDDYALVFKYLRFKSEISKIKNLNSRSSTFRPVNIQLYKPSEDDVKFLIPKIEIRKKYTSPKDDQKNTAQKQAAKLLEEKEEALKQKTLALREKEQEIRLLTDVQDWMLEYVKTFLFTKDKRPTLKTSVSTKILPSCGKFMDNFSKDMEKIQGVLDSNAERIKQLKREKNADGAQQRYKKEAVENLAQQRVGQAETKEVLKLKQQQSSIEESLHAVIQENEKLIAKLEKAEQDKEKFRESYDSISSQFSIIKQKLRSTETELEEVRTRLSRVAGAQLTSGNPGITDLGDIHRPTKIAEMYSSLYDTEWTEAMDELIKTKWTEQQIIKHLSLTLQVCYRACNKIAEEQLIEIYQKLDIGASKEEVSQKIVTHVAEVKQLKDVRKGLAVKMFKSIAKMILEEKRFDKELLGNSDTDRELLDEICRTPYIERCVLVCWLMVIQDPEMYIDEDLKPGSAFNKDTYREYTQRGTKVAFSVWPALYLNKKGPLMMKGVAQPEKPDYM